MSAPEYVIETIQDLFKVPRDRRDAMLGELSDWMELIDDLSDAGVDVLGGPISVQSFIWMDDGKEGLREVRFTISAAATNG